jgi:hypothetical protein
MRETPSEYEARLSRPETRAGALQRAALAILLEHEQTGALPTSTRFVFYELEQAGVVRKTRPGETRRVGGEQGVTDAVLALRERRLVPWSWIVDETREAYEWSYAATVAAYVLNSVGEARIDTWDGQPPPLILCESRTFGGVLRRTLAPEYLCPIAATNGQVGGFLHTDIVPILEQHLEQRPVVYIGDLDLSGGQIEANTRRVLEREVGELGWRRLALTEEQAAVYRLEPIEKTDRRYHHGGRHLAIEVEALGQALVTSIIRDALDELLPRPIAETLADEKEQRRHVRDVLEGQLE